MRIGTRSVLYGVHQIILHPIFVALAWRDLFKVWPTWREAVCIFLHDFPGYWNKPNMDGPEGRTHPELGAKIAERLLGSPYGDFTRFHSREYAKLAGAEPSLLAWADKWSIWIEPTWLYMLRGKLSGEIREFKTHAPAHVQNESDEYWYQWYRTKVRNLKEIREILDNQSCDCGCM